MKNLFRFSLRTLLFIIAISLISVGCSTKELSIVRSGLQQAKVENKSLQENVKAKDKELEEVQGELQQAKAENKSLQEKIKAKDNELEEVQSELQQAKVELTVYKLVGIWEFERIVKETIEGPSSTRATIKPDPGQYIIFNIYHTYNTVKDGKTYKGAFWLTSGETLTIWPAEEGITALRDDMTYTLSGNKLTLEAQTEDGKKKVTTTTELVRVSPLVGTWEFKTVATYLLNGKYQIVTADPGHYITFHKDHTSETKQFGKTYKNGDWSTPGNTLTIEKVESGGFTYSCKGVTYAVSGNNLTVIAKLKDSAQITKLVKVSE